jgi:hypothetical protein
MEKQQTAVEFLLEEIECRGILTKELRIAFQQAKEMEKEQMKESFIVALDIVDYTILSTLTINESFEDYYNETFKNK